MRLPGSRAGSRGRRATSPSNDEAPQRLRISQETVARTQCLCRLVTVSPAATVSATATAATVTTASATTTATTGALFARPGDIDVEGAPAQFFAIQTVNGLLRLLRRTHGDEGKPARPTGGPVGDEVGFDNRAIGREGILQIVLGDFEVEVPDE